MTTVEHKIELHKRLFDVRAELIKIRVETDNLDEDHTDAVQHIREATTAVEQAMHDLDLSVDLGIDTDPPGDDEWLHELDPEERDGE